MDKYEGHTQGHWAITTRKGTWVVHTQDNGDIATTNDYEDAKLIADAPKLLAEVKRLREGIKKALIPTDKVPWTHPMVKLDDLRDELKKLIGHDDSLSCEELYNDTASILKKVIE